MLVPFYEVIHQTGVELLATDGDWVWKLEAMRRSGQGDTFHALFREIYKAVLAGRAPERPLYATFADGHHEMAVCDAIAQSAREGRWVDVAG